MDASISDEDITELPDNSSLPSEEEPSERDRSVEESEDVEQGQQSVGDGEEQQQDEEERPSVASTKEAIPSTAEATAAQPPHKPRQQQQFEREGHKTFEEAATIPEVTSSKSSSSSDKKQQYSSPEDEPMEDLSEYDLDWRPPKPSSRHGVTAPTTKSNRFPGGRTTSTDSRASDIESVDISSLGDSSGGHLGNLKQKPIFQPPPRQSNVDRNVNLMARSERTETASHDGTASSAGGRSSVSLGGGSARLSGSSIGSLMAPSRPTNLSSSQRGTSASSQRPSQGSLNNIDFIDEDISMIDALANVRLHKQGSDSRLQAAMSSSRSKSSHSSTKSSSTTTTRRAKSFKEVALPVVLGCFIILAIVVISIPMIPYLENQLASNSGRAGESKSGGGFAKYGNIVVMPTHTTEEESSMRDNENENSATTMMAQELRALIEQHGISLPQSFVTSSTPNENSIADASFVMTPQTKALHWLVEQSDPLQASAKTRDVQHQKLFQRYALAVLWHSTHAHESTSMERSGEYPTTTKELEWVHEDGWLTESSVCTWHGVVCDEDNSLEEDEIIIWLHLSHNGLVGTLPILELGKTLRWNLQSLDISGNNIRGSLEPITYGERIDDDLFAWPSLTDLHLQDNALSGIVPFRWIKESTSLKEIDLSGNMFHGNLRPLESWSNLGQLQRLELDHNLLTGHIPILHFENLEYLDLQQNEFQGTFPRSLHMLTKLGKNQSYFIFCISLLTFFGRSHLTRVCCPLLGISPVELRTGNNSLSGTLTTNLERMVNLQVFSVENNFIQGTLPDVFDALSNLSKHTSHLC